MTRSLPWVLAFSLVSAAAPAATPMSVPPNPFVHKGACPFECCTFRDWTTNKPVTLLDKPNGKAKVASIPAKTVVRGVTGDVYSVPLSLTATHDFAPDAPIKKGDTFYALHSAGEGFWTVWFKGKTYDVDMTEAADSAVLEKVSNAWWVKIRTKDGKTGWVLDSQQFDNQDSCG